MSKRPGPDRNAKARNATDTAWTWSYGYKPHTIAARERIDRGGLIEVRYTDPEKPGREKRRKHFLDSSLTVRNARGGIDHALEREVQEAIRQINARIVTGQEARPVTTESENNELTLADGFRRLLHPELGKYSNLDTTHVRYNVQPRGILAIEILRTSLQRSNKPLPTWETFRPAHARLIWRTLARTYQKEKKSGVRAAEQIIDNLYAAAAWLRQEELIPRDACLPQPRWRKLLKDEWQTITGVSVAPKRPRHTREEMRRIFDVLADPTIPIDPRIRLAIELGAELRIGQVLRTQRSQLSLSDISSDEYESRYKADLATLDPIGVLGRLEIRGQGKKGGEVVVLTPEQRHAVDVALQGYLQNYERAYRQSGMDYPLFPAGRLVKGVAKVMVLPLAADKTAARTWFRELEVLAKVSHVPGRGWYGLRRTSTDVAPEHSSDARELNSLGGWTDSDTRENIYQDRMQVTIKARASAVRRAARGAVGRPKESTPIGVDDRTLETLASQLTQDQITQLMALVSAQNAQKTDLCGPSAAPNEKTPGAAGSRGINDHMSDDESTTLTHCDSSTYDEVKNRDL